MSEPLRLPQELNDIILDIVADRDRPSLASCALVHRALLGPSQRRLFRQIAYHALSPSSQQLLATLQGSPHLAEYVQTLLVSDGQPVLGWHLSVSYYDRTDDLREQAGSLITMLPKLRHVLLLWVVSRFESGSSHLRGAYEGGTSSGDARNLGDGLSLLSDHSSYPAVARLPPVLAQLEDPRLREPLYRSIHRTSATHESGYHIVACADRQRRLAHPHAALRCFRLIVTG